MTRRCLAQARESQARAPQSPFPPGALCVVTLDVEPRRRVIAALDSKSTK